MVKWNTGIILNPGSGTYNKSHVGVVGGVSIGDAYYTTKSDNNLIVQGKVGIGTTSPVSGFHIHADRDNTTQVEGIHMAVSYTHLTLPTIYSV